MKKILFSLLGIITLGLINFSSAGSYTYNGHIKTNVSSSTATSEGNFYFRLPIPNVSLVLSVPSDISNISCTISNLTFSQLNNLTFNSIKYVLGSTTGGIDYIATTNSNQDYSTFTFNGNGLYSYSSTNNSIYGYFSFLQIIFYYQRPVSLNDTVNFDFSCTISGDNIINQSDLTNYSQCSSDLSTCQSSLSSANSSLSTCQSDLTTCQNSSSSCSPSGQCTVSDKLSENIIFSGSSNFSSAGYTNMFNYGNYGAGTYCLKFSSSNAQTLSMGFANGGTTAPTNLYSLYNDQYGNWICLYGNKPYLNIKLNASSNTISYEVYKLTDLLSDDIPCSESSTPECDDWTQLQCESEYNLIPESSVTSEYCEEEFNLIDPENCPASGGTGDVQWSSFFVNSHQIQGASNIYLWLPDFLNWDYTYIDSGSTLEIDVENEGDQDYIQGIIDINSYRPTNEEFTQSFVGGLTLLIPYIVVVLFVVAIWKLIKKIFK